NKKLIVFDTDGVIFKSQLLLRLSRYSGIINYIRTLCLCFLFSINYINIHELLEMVYVMFRGLKEEDLWRVYHKMRHVKHAQETIRYIKGRGHCVALISSGVPDFLMKHLSERLKADCGCGIDVKMDNGVFTGKIGGLLASTDGKVQVVEQLLMVNKMTWNDVIVVGDDRNNLDMMERAKVSIGFNSYYPVRMKAKYLVDSHDLRKVLDCISLEDDPSFDEISSSKRHEISFSWMQEFRRKGVHFGAVMVPVFADINFPITLDLLMAITALFIFSELLRLNGVWLPVISIITRLCMRNKEQRRFTIAPVTLSLGIIFSLLLFPKLIASVVIVIVAFSDSIATVIGRFYGRVKIPYNRGKSVEGSIAFLVSAFICSIFYLPLGIALIVSFVSCIIESLPIEFDNMSIPLGTGLFLGLII
ncbi:MAG: HAD-IB family phosphatase, partial [Thermodesulfobacteriota bacterium]